MRDNIKIPVEDQSLVGEARRIAASLCRAMRFSELDMGRVSIIVTEAATNLLKHATGGELLLRSLEYGELMGLEILSIDRGPGMADPARCTRDGVSTARSLGTGLGAILRASKEFEIFTEPGQGTVMMSRFWAGSLPHDLPAQPLEVGAICLPVATEEVCGDGWSLAQEQRRSVIMACDGLGHGPEAAHAAREARRLFQEYWTRPLPEIVEALHTGLRGTRGAALAVLEVDHQNQVVRYCGIGNIEARILIGEGQRRLLSHNGIAGQKASKIQEFTYPWDENGLIVMHSDGIGTRWHLDDYPGLALRHPSVIAGVLYRDFRHQRDDCLVMVGKNKRARARGRA